MLRGDLAFIADRVGVLAEIQALEADVAAAERRHGVIPELLDLRRRLDVVRGAVLAQMCGAWRAHYEARDVVMH